MHPTDEYQNTCAPRLTDQRFTNDQRFSRGRSRKPWNAFANSSFMGRVSPLKSVENASRAPKARAKKMFGLFGEACADLTPKHAPKKIVVCKKWCMAPNHNFLPKHRAKSAILRPQGALWAFSLYTVNASTRALDARAKKICH